MPPIGITQLKQTKSFLNNVLNSHPTQKIRVNLKMEDGKLLHADQTVPIDTYKIAYIIHFLLGAGNLLPWNAYITAVDYFGYLYPSQHVEKVFSVAYMGSSVLVLVVVVCFGGWSRNLSFKMRMNLGFSLFVLSLMVPPTMDWTSGGGGHRRGSNMAFGITVASVVICGLADGLIGGSLIGSAGKLPKQYMQAVFAGTASSGIYLSLIVRYLVIGLLLFIGEHSMFVIIKIF